MPNATQIRAAGNVGLFRLPSSHRTRQAAFTLVEALLALAITTIAGSALLLSLSSSLQATQDARERTIAMGMARQLMHEIAGKRYMAVGVSPYQTNLSASAWELAGAGRERFDDIDDFHLATSQPAADIWGVPLGQDDGAGGYRHPHFQVPSGYFDKWRREAEVYYVSQYNQAERLPGGQTSNYRAVEVRILIVEPDRNPREVAHLREVFSYVPPVQ